MIAYPRTIPQQAYLTAVLVENVMIYGATRVTAQATHKKLYEKDCESWLSQN